MPRSIFTFFVGMMAVALLAGCSSSGVTARSYVKVEERVDQDMSGGNYGYFSGSPVAPDRSGVSKTRDIYVFEVTKEIPEDKDAGVIVLPPRKVYESAPLPEESPRVSEPEPIALPSFDEVDSDSSSVEGEAKFVDYTIEKDDTLQKISKKFYDSYSKWTRIYDANKDVIPDPNRIKPGIRLRIPVD